MNVSDRDAYHKIITDSYDKRSETYNESKWHRFLAEQLVDYNPPNKNESVLDIGTGTGAAAFHSASLVGPGGAVIGVDISEGMIKKANEFLKSSTHSNLSFQLADGENLPFSKQSFNRVYCASAFFWIADKEKTLSHWFELLKPGGSVGFHAWPESSYVFGYIARRVLKKYEINYLAHSPTGTQDKCIQLLENNGYENIKIIVIESGNYISVEQAKEAWVSLDHYPIGQYPHPIANVSSEILKQAKADYDAEMDILNTEKGVWNDTTMYYVYGNKPTNT